MRLAAAAASAAYRADGGDGSGWALRAASVAGVRHRLAGAGPEDAYGWCLVAPGGSDTDDLIGGVGTIVVAVADGVGSVPGSAAAADGAVDAACAAAVAALAGGAHTGGTLAGGADLAGADAGGEMWPAVFAAAATAVHAAGGATTLVVAVIGPDGDGGRAGAVGRIGDSTALVLGASGWVELWPVESGDDAPVSTATAALSHRPDAPAFETVPVTLADGEVLVLVSDGVANPLRDGPTTVAPVMADALREPPTPLGLAVLADFSRQGCFDDRTIAGLWPRPGRPTADDSSDSRATGADEEPDHRRI